MSLWFLAPAWHVVSTRIFKNELKTERKLKKQGERTMESRKKEWEGRWEFWKRGQCSGNVIP